MSVERINFLFQILMIISEGKMKNFRVEDIIALAVAVGIILWKGWNL